MMWLLVFIIFTFAYEGETQTDFNPYMEAFNKRPWKCDQDYVQVRPGAFLFYWLYYADGSSTGAHQKPLIIWIQGGPGLAASGIGNFAEFGPLNMDMEPRNHTWVNGRNVLLIDHPVGTGFSYAVDDSLLVRTDREMAIDLSKLIKGFFKKHKAFRQTPTYIIGQSYGGKLSPRLGYYLYTAIQKKSLKMNFKGIGIGSGWVNPRESALGIIDQSTYLRCKQIVKNMSVVIDNNEFMRALKLDSVLFTMLHWETSMEINFNNINQVSPYPALDKLEIKVNKYVKPTLSHVVNQSLQWEYRSDIVYENLYQNFFVPSTKFLEMLLNSTKLKITVYNGNLDVVTPLAGATNWVHKLQWHGAEEFRDARREPIRGFRNGFYKKSRQLSLWSVFGAGHWVPEDNPTAMEQILEHMIDEAE
ncbi:retinoid-inducible serine carboxypeptidase-like isoform X2 [Choristoneura fumiferana]|uniref:retinoid-inducible serine carboxypeptidase-like isoform X2 n=1 Tax=Choristoneura fumiferana TaxID=7141 RepID=UPI003D154103